MTHHRRRALTRLLLLSVLVAPLGAAAKLAPPALAATPAPIPAPTPSATPEATPDPAAAAREHQRLVAIQQREPAPTLATGSGVTALDVRFASAALGREMRYRVLLPRGYATSHRYYPVLYLLHGYMNPFYEWDKQTSLARLLDERRYGLIVVLPQLDNSFCLNAAEEPKDRYMTCFFRDLIPEVESRYRARSEPPARAIGGVSMGGYGAMLYGLRFPQAFSFVASFSGAVNFIAESDDFARNMAPFPLGRIVGKPDSATRLENDRFRLVESVEPTTLPPLWITVGSRDFLFPENVDFLRALQKRGIAVDFHHAPGDHEWVYWDAELPRMLDALAHALLR